MQPVLQVIDPGARDVTTGVLLQDVWRYARHFWSIRTRALRVATSSISFAMQRCLNVRSSASRRLGTQCSDSRSATTTSAGRRTAWSVACLIWTPTSASRSPAIRSGATRSVEKTYSGDLRVPTDPLEAAPATVAALEEIERRSAADRLAKLDAAGEERDADYLLIRDAQTAAEHGNADTVDWEFVARTALYRRKRAGALADLYRALATLTDLGFTDGTGDLSKALVVPDGRRAIETALRRIKQEVLASNVMELITCGALPPYRAVLGGKLVD